MRALPGRRGVIRPLACRRQLSSDDDRLAFNRGICLPEADDPGHDLVRKSDINEDHMVVRMVNDTVQECNELGVALDTKAALKHPPRGRSRKQQPWRPGISNPGVGYRDRADSFNLTGTLTSSSMQFSPDLAASLINHFPDGRNRRALPDNVPVNSVRRLPPDRACPRVRGQRRRWSRG